MARIKELEAQLAQPAQEPPSEWAGIKAVLDEYGLQAIDFVADFKAALAQPAQGPEREALKLALEALEEYADYEGKTRAADEAITAITAALAQPAREWNFCERCGKRTADLSVIHTCTPPQENT